MEHEDSLLTDPAPWTMFDVAAALDVAEQTVRSWREDGILPDPDVPIRGRPCWKAGTIRRWAIRTGRMNPEGAAVRLKPPGRPRRDGTGPVTPPRRRGTGPTADELVPGTRIATTTRPRDALAGYPYGELYASCTPIGAAPATVTAKVWHSGRGTYTLVTGRGEILNVPPRLRLVTVEG